MSSPGEGQAHDDGASSRDLGRPKDDFNYVLAERQGIRTHSRVFPTHAFQRAPSTTRDISPYIQNQSFTGEWMSPETRIVSDLLMCCDHLGALYCRADLLRTRSRFQV